MRWLASRPIGVHADEDRAEAAAARPLHHHQPTRDRIGIDVVRLRMYWVFGWPTRSLGAMPDMPGMLSRAGQGP